MNDAREALPFDRLAGLTGRAVAPALGLALLSAATLLPLAWIAGLLSGGSGFTPIALLLLCWLHGVFIVTLTARLLEPQRGLLGALAGPGLRGGSIMGVALLAFAALDAAGSGYSCADGAAYGRSAVPMLPWLWIGWLLLNLFAVPTRLAAPSAVHSRGIMIWQWRILLLTPFALVVLLLGQPFQDRVVDCTAPFEGYGLFEGGLVLLPLLGLFWFVASTTMAVLAAAYLNPVQTEDAL